MKSCLKYPVLSTKWLNCCSQSFLFHSFSITPTSLPSPAMSLIAISLPIDFCTILIPAMIPSSQFCCFAAGLSKCHCIKPSPWDQSHFSGGEHAAVGVWKVARGPPTPPSYAAGGCWVMVSAKSSKRPWLPVQYLEAAPSHWKRDLKEEGCSPWPQPNDFSSSVKEMLTEGSVCHHRWEIFGW